MSKTTIEAIMDATFGDASQEDIVHLVYEAGGEISPAAERDYVQASDWKRNPQEFIGHFVSYRKTKNGDPVLTLWVHNRGLSGRYRSFNPNLGRFHSIYVRRA